MSLLKKIAVDIVWSVRQSVTIDWNLKESVRAGMRTKVRRLLAKYDYPPDLEEKAESPWFCRRLGLLDFDQGLVAPLGIVERGFELGRR